MSDRRFRVLAIASHPVQYAAPIFRLMAVDPRLDFHVAYCSLRGAESGHDPEFGRDVKWDVPLLNGYSWTHLPNRGSGSESFWGLYNPGLWKFIREGHFDAVLCYTGYLRASFWIAYGAAKLSRTAFLFGTDANTLASRDNDKKKQQIKRWAWPLLFGLADQVIVPSSCTRNLIVSLGLPDDRVTLTPYVSDNDWWTTLSAAVDRERVRALWEARSGDTVVFFCAKLQAWKRPADLLRAFARANLPNMVLVFAGDGPLRGQLESEAAALGVTSRVRFLGFVNQSQLPALYSSADVMVLPSEYEPFGIVVNEAMCCGCPVIASDRVGAVRDLVVHGRNGFVYPCGDVDALAEILRRCVREKSMLADLKKEARARISSWSPRENIEGTVSAVTCAVSRIQRSRAPATPVASEPTGTARQRSLE
jgi:glycosyltransferase involved in cell wall biosynthesis